ncbi:hypothetical protein [Amycolatopsis thermalba]|uniref:hypothetical protein n=1 Tax=Amycolatopsis thermalba TaxID=944492 RepID=UPI0013BEA9C0|nr:hypothetical protein [Amycolatopsis thermalba]
MGRCGVVFAALFMEGEAGARSGATVVRDALFRVVLARGVRLTTDLDHLPLHAAPGWRMHVTRRGELTLEWPHFQPLLADAVLDVPGNWVEVAAGPGVVLVFVGSGFGLREGESGGRGHAATQVRRAAETGALAAGAVSFTASA